MICPHCKKTFARKDIMMRHQRSNNCLKKDTADLLSPVEMRASTLNQTIQVASPIKAANWVQSDSKWKFKHPATIMITGPTGSGKTTTLLNLINKGMFDPLPKHIVVFHGEEQDIYKDFPPGTKFIRGWSTDEIDKLPTDTLVIIDDLMSEVKDCKYMSKLFTKISHHRTISVVWLTQNLFPRGKECRDISLNSQYLLLFPNPRDQAQIRYLSAQMFPGQTRQFVETFKKATETPYDPIMIILRQDQPNSDRIMMNILSERPQYVDL